MKLIAPLLAGVLTGLFGAAVGINGIIILMGIMVVIGIINDNVGQSVNIFLLTALATAIASGWVTAIVILGIAVALYYMYYYKENADKHIVQ